MRSGDRGFTIIELMLAVLISAIFAGTTIWAAFAIVPSYRLVGAVTRFHSETRSAAALAARLNKPVNLHVAKDQAGCKSSYALESEGRVYQHTCLEADFPGVVLGPSGSEAITCAGEADLPTLPPCSLCDGGSITFLPTGEVITEGEDGDSVIFNLAKDGNKHSTHSRAVGLRRGLGHSRIYHWSGSTWSCK